MAILPSNSFYSSFARKTKGSGSVPSKSPFSFQGSLGNPSTGNVSGSAIKPGTNWSPSTGTPSAASGGGSSSAGPPAGFTATQSNLPPDPVYQAVMSGLTGTETNTIAGLVQDRGAYLQNAGYIEDPTTHAISYDPNNPYSQAALLRKHYQESKLGNTTSYAAQGQLYAGSLQNAQNATTDQFNTSDNTLTNAVINFLARNTNQQDAAHNAYNTGAGQALATSVQNAPNNPLYNPASAAGSNGGVVSTDANGNMAITAANGPVTLQQNATGSQSLAPGYTMVLGPDGKLLYFIDPNGNRVGG